MANYQEMKIVHWMAMTDAEKMETIKANGAGLNYRAIMESLECLDSIIKHLADMKYIKRLNRYSTMGAAIHVRFETILADGSRLFKVNNNHVPEYNRFILRTFPEFVGFLESKNYGVHLIVEGIDCKIDYWPSTGKFIARNGKHGRGVRNLLKLCKRPEGK